MKTWNLKFASYKKPDDIFNFIENGTKTIETRPVNPESENNYADIKVRDVIICTSLDSNRNITKHVKFVHIYKSIDEMIKNEYPNSIFPGVQTRENLSKVYEDVKNKWGSDYNRKVETYGIVAIGFE